MKDLKKYEKKYSEEGFWKKLEKYAKDAGYQIVFTALKLYYAARRPETPAWAKASIFGALGYFILPFDLIWDFIPIVGYSDDLSVLLLAVGAVSLYISDDVERQAKETLAKWFGA